MQAFTGNILHTLEKHPGVPELEAINDGYILCDDQGKIVELGSGQGFRKTQNLDRIHDFAGRWLLPGFVDTHIHYPQLNIIGSYGEELLEWLERYTFPEEEKFSDRDYALAVAELFCKTLLVNGTTTAAVFGTSHLKATQTLQRSMAAHGLSGWVGKSSMDRNAPASLLVPPEQDLAELEILRQDFSDATRMHLALTPRFAPSCTDFHLRSLGQMKARYPELKVQTHFAENKAEIAWVQQLFPNHSDYLHVYDDFGLLGPDTLLAHGVHIDEKICQTLVQNGVSLSHCPSSNMFLGSGLFPAQVATASGLAWSLGSDVGAGTSFSMWRTMSDCYKVQKLNVHSVSACELLYRATLMAAKTLGLADEIGNFTVGKYCDLQVVDTSKNSVLNSRISQVKDEHEWLFAVITLADDRLVEAVYTAGDRRH